jgi:hypothetical protein
MERKARGVKLDGSIYNSLFEPASGVTEVVKKGASLEDTLALFPKYVSEYAYQANRLTAAMRDIEGDVKKTCHNIWYFLLNYIAYTPDTVGIEQVRSTNRLWSDRIGDCDCFAFTISCVLHNLKIDHILRVTQYKNKDGFQHIYVVVPHEGKEIIVDPCLEVFNVEVPYINKKEVKMDLHFLNGFDDDYIARNSGSVDAHDLLSSGLFYDEVGSIRSFFDKAKDKVKSTTQNIKTNLHNASQKAGSAIKNSLHEINRVNPATTALRLGILAGMKTNLLGVASGLRFSYLSEHEAAKRGLNMKRYPRYKKVREKLEKIFFNAGGNPENLKEAILTGKGNESKEVALNGFGFNLGSANEQSSLVEVLGEEMFFAENAELLNTVNGEGLGVVTAAVVSAASGAIAMIGGILKAIGDLKQSGEAGTSPAWEQLANEDKGGSEQSDPNSEQRETEPPKEPDSGTVPDSSGDGASDTPPIKDERGAFGKLKDAFVENKTAFLIVGATVVAAGAIYLVNKYLVNKPQPKPRSVKQEVDGPPKRKKYAGARTLHKLKMKPLS